MDEWADLKSEIRAKYPEVEQISIAEFSNIDQEEILLIDVREPVEYEVSHINSAVNAQDFSEIEELAKGYPGQVILYCSVGYRSSAMASRLKKARLDNVANLEGSIFEWTNTGHPVYRGDQIVREVHQFDEKWGRFLLPEFRAK